MADRREFPSHPAALRDIRHFVHEAVTGGAYGAADADEVTLAVSEACANAIMESTADRIEIRLLVEDDRIEVEVIDPGKRDASPTPPTASAGHGLPVIRRMMDEVRIEPRTEAHPQTTVRMVRLPRDL
jgi:anti-sigma regulatory factor (Ser/Thr protein kinase)